MQFSDRTAWDLTEDELARSVRQRRAAGLPLLDLTVANPTACGVGMDAEQVTAALGGAAALRYSPESLGMRSARAAVAGYYAELGAAVDPDRICLTSSTSEAYSHLFRLLCGPADAVLSAQPSYPLLDYIARLDDVQLQSYPLLCDPGAQVGEAAGAWAVDLHALQQAITAQTRAVIVVHPNNPTGNYASAAERHALRRLCAERGLALLVDEVFLDYALEADERDAVSFAAEPAECLTFVLSGLSKVCALPQMKLSWMVALGPEPLVAQALARLEVMLDTFLSVGTPVQAALPAWLAARPPLQARIRERMLHNLAALDAQLLGTATQRLPVQGGWTVVLRVPRTQEFAQAALQLGVLVQPGEFYGMGPGRVVLSLLTPPELWREGLKLLRPLL